MKKLALLALLLLLGISFPAAYRSQCDIQYEQCMVACCSKCNAQVGMDAASKYVCQIRITNELDQNCMNACNYCYENYSGCVISDVQGDNVNPDNLGQPLIANGSQQGGSSSGAVPNPGGAKSGGMCGSVALLGFAALAAFARK